MPSPFPGMDPYPENPKIFPNLHDSLITYIRENLQANLPPPYYAAIGRRGGPRGTLGGPRGTL